MAAAPLQQRSYQQNVYHTPQSNSPASVASSQGHDQHARMYAHPQTQIPQTMYTYPQYTVPQPTYPPHPGQQPQMMTSQPLMPHSQSQPVIAHQSPAQSAGMTNSPRTQPKLEPGVQRPMDPTSLQRSPTGPTNPNSNTPSNSSPSGNGAQAGQASGQGVNPNAAPGPIPATTPLVVRQDNNGVQWIAFEYSRDRVKMEYTIRCDVESVLTDSLPTDFRTDNCVYPRACCNKDNYKGNRLQYENECNTVGWALAELNPCLRGKRGLIQRAVDSWRNSNQDPRLRSRRVRRMAKINTRKTASSSHPPNHMAAPRETGIPPSSTNSMATPVPQRPPPTHVNMGAAPQLQPQHHHHAHPDGSHAGMDDVKVNGDFDQRQQLSKPSPAPIRPSNVFHGNPAYPTPPNPYAASMPPQLHSGMEHIQTHNAVSASTAMDMANEDKSPSASPEKQPDRSSLFGKLPEGKRRKFFTVEDPERNGHKVRVKMALHECPVHEAPDSYRKRNSVYPRSWFPTEMQLSPSSRGPKGRFLEDREAAESKDEGDIKATLVKLPMSEGGDGDLRLPGLGRKARKREEQLNDMGYRISWSQGRVFSDRVIFLQQSLDVYRSKMRDAIVASGQEVETVAPLYEARVGKRSWDETKRRGRGKGARE
ncbi:hypothetical protein ACLMJK_003103 [Lecanora helva]